jgi:hypothetical protein
MSKSPIAWLEDVAKHDYDAGINYLSLKFDEKRAADAIDSASAGSFPAAGGSAWLKADRAGEDRGRWNARWTKPSRALWTS